MDTTEARKRGRQSLPLVSPIFGVPSHQRHRKRDSSQRLSNIVEYPLPQDNGQNQVDTRIQSEPGNDSDIKIQSEPRYTSPSAATGRDRISALFQARANNQHRPASRASVTSPSPSPVPQLSAPETTSTRITSKMKKRTLDSLDNLISKSSEFGNASASPVPLDHPRRERKSSSVVLNQLLESRIHQMEQKLAEKEDTVASLQATISLLENQTELAKQQHALDVSVLRDERDAQELVVQGLRQDLECALKAVREASEAQDFGREISRVTEALIVETNCLGHSIAVLEDTCAAKDMEKAELSKRIETLEAEKTSLLDEFKNMQPLVKRNRISLFEDRSLALHHPSQASKDLDISENVRNFDGVKGSCARINDG